MATTIISVDGNIGAGKSTVLRRLAARHGYVVIPEPVEEWEEMLARFYLDPRRWALTLQCKILTGMSEVKKKALASGAAVVLVERSPLSARVFLRNLYDTDKIDEAELEVYDGLHARLAWEPDTTFLMSVTPAECHRRLEARGRLSEAGLVPLSYLECLDSLYKIMATLASVNTVEDDDNDIDAVADRLHRRICEWRGAAAARAGDRDAPYAAAAPSDEARPKCARSGV
jgi:deoxyadenosine/deoxycytidine kinase